MPGTGLSSFSRVGNAGRDAWQPATIAFIRNMESRRRSRPQKPGFDRLCEIEIDKKEPARDGFDIKVSTRASREAQMHRHRPDCFGDRRRHRHLARGADARCAVDLGIKANSLAPLATTIVPGIHLLGELDPSAAYVVESSAGLVLFDTGLDPKARLLTAQLVKLGLEPKNIRAIFLTHVHGDHTGGAEHLRKTTGAPVARRTRRRRRPSRGQLARGVFQHLLHAERLSAPVGDRRRTQRRRNLRFRRRQGPGAGDAGHTPGSICYLVER